MTPRPRTIADADILDATQRVIARVGPAKFTLADVAEDVGLVPATLVQRFGSKRGLMLALAAQWPDRVNACFEAVRATHDSPLGALLSVATEMSRGIEEPEEMANHLAYLQLDLSDPEFYAIMLEGARRTLRGYRRLLDDAVAAAELVPCDTKGLARVVNAVTGGSLIAWAVFQRGRAETWVRRDLETVLGPYRIIE